MKLKVGKNYIFHQEDFNELESYAQVAEVVGEVCESWSDSLIMREEQRGDDGQVLTTGLRPPQIGAIYSALSHWTLSHAPKTIVMPTGTGKTETMIGITLAKACRLPLVTVPTDALREQISQKFLSLGIFKQFGLLNEDSKQPFVGILKKTPESAEELQNFLSACNVVVTTMDLLRHFTPQMQRILADKCTHLFIDEAHHTPAPTWETFRKNFKEKPILQFTATPFREDGKPIDGKIIYNYPLAKAQQEGYFKAINFIPVIEFNEASSDRKIAETAIAQLRADIEQGFNHLIMARGNSINRAREIVEFYRELSPEFQPEIIHSRFSKREKDRILGKIRQHESRIIVCVDMLGEGFDLPQLKIAALHDIHKSLTPTLQFSGRFTRTEQNIGDATFIANVADPEVKESLERLYSENPDWNEILRYEATEAIESEIDFAELMSGFTTTGKKFPIQNLLPNMSTVIFRMEEGSAWNPENYKSYFDKNTELYPLQNAERKVLILVTCSKQAIDWGRIKDIHNLVWNLYVIFYDEDQRLLFINSSNKGSHHQRLAQALGGIVTHITGDQIFRSFADITRLVLQNAGLNYAYAGPLRYVMYTGIDIVGALGRARVGTTYRSNFFGHGYENGRKTSIGCSYKGRIWSRRDARISELIEWCSHIGRKVLNDDIEVDRILEGLLKPTVIYELPEKVPIAVEFSSALLHQQETTVKFITENGIIDFWECELNIEEEPDGNKIVFAFVTESERYLYELTILPDPGGFTILPIDVGNNIQVRIGSATWPLHEYFQEEPPIIRFHDASLLEGNVLVELPDQRIDPFNLDNIETWDWTGVVLRKESQGIVKDPESIQFKVISYLKDFDYDLIIDDDGKGEMADVIAIKFNEQNVSIELFHCKFSSKKKAGARIDDLYVVCGQAQKSIQYKDKVLKMFDHIKRREGNRLNRGEPSRFEVGDQKTLMELKRRLRVLPTTWSISIVQPGVSKAGISADQRRVLGATELYLQETYQIPLKVILNQ
jgi:superfamily II DNA or RNA helicase